MKKKLLFLGFLVGIFAALMILPASAIELPSEDAGCDFCRATWEQMEDKENPYHCDGKCTCELIVCPTCGDQTVLVYCGRIHSYNVDRKEYSGSGYIVPCYYCDAVYSTPSAISSHSSTTFCSSDDSTVAPSCLSRGYFLKVCKKSHAYCLHGGYSRSNFTDATLEHSYVFVETVSPSCGSWSGDLYECSGCGFQKYENPVFTAHTPADTGIVTPATCTEVGYTTHTCSTCSATYTVDETPVTGHTYTSEVTTPATCSSTGVKTYTCSNCSDSYTESIAKTAHSFTSAVTTPATCSSTGVKTYTCSNCSDSYTETIPKTDHSYTTVVTAPTCTTAGYTTYTCTVCAYSYTGDNTAATGHKNTTKINTAATCTTAGSQTTTCSVCGNTTTSEIPATGHSYKSTTVVPNCTQGGYTVYTCSTCSDSYQGDQIAATGHKYQDVVTEPTCTKGGYTKHTCSVCQDTYTDAVTSATGHNYKDLVTAPTCTVRGYTDHTCISCGDNYRDTFVAALGHTEERYGLDWKCTVCGRIRVVTTGIRAVGSILDGFQIFGVGFASGAVDLFDGMVMNGEELTTIASAAFALAGLVLIGVVVYAVIRKFTKRR